MTGHSLESQMLHILLADFAPMIAVIVFIVIAVATWQTYRKSVIEQLHMANQISQDLADTALKHVKDVKAELATVQRSLEVQERRVLRVEIDLERKTRLLNAARNENGKMELLIGLMAKHVPDDAKPRWDELTRELSEDRRTFAEEQGLWEDAQTAQLAHYGDDITKPVELPPRRSFGIINRRP